MYCEKNQSSFDTDILTQHFHICPQSVSLADKDNVSGMVGNTGDAPEDGKFSDDERRGTM